MRSFFYLILFLFTISTTVAGDPDHLEVVVLSQNNLCDDDLPNRGAAYAKIIEDDGKEDTNLKDYTINWFIGSTTTGTPVFTGAAYDQMAAGTYTVQAIHDKSSFVDVVEVTIERTSIGPDAYVESITNAKNCKENDGKAKVRVRADFPQEGPDHSHDNIKDCKHDICWNFVWYEGNNPFIGDVVAVGADAKDLKPGTYAVVVTNEADGCQTVVSLSVGLDAEEPVVEGTVIANITDCDNLTAGSLESFVTGEPNNNYEFDWYIGDFVGAAPDFNNQRVITGLAAGNYTVVAKDKSSGCLSFPLTLTVEDLTSIPVIATTLDLEQTSCDTANPNGAVSATADGATTGYSFEWFSGQSTTTMIGTGPSITGLAAGFYTVRATNTSDPNSQNCSATAEVEVTTNLVDPNPINSTITDQSYCINPNGAIATTVGGDTAGYTFYWFNGNVASPDINSPDFTGATYNNRLAGEYTLIVENNTTLCTTDPQFYTIDDLTAKPVITVSSFAEETACDAPNGAVSVAADGQTAGYTFRWFNGVSTAVADEITPSPGASITSLSAGTYTVLAINSTTGCNDTYEHTVLDQTVTPVPTTTIIDQTQCTPLDGEIQANVGGNTSDYNFYWFIGNVASPDINSPDSTGATIRGLTAGEYTLVVEHDASKCTSAAQVLTVDDLTPTISGTINLVAAQTSCGAPNGELTVSATGGTSYTYEWFTGTDATGTSFASGASATGLSAQTYTVVITDLTSGCTDEVSRAVPNNVQPPLVSVDNVNPNTICDPALSVAADYDGSIEVTAGIPLTDYSYYFFDGDVASPVPASADYDVNNVYSGLQSGDYTVVIVENATGCESDRVVVTVPDATVDPVGSIALDLEQTACVGSNGELTASATTGGGASADGYSFAWYEGTGTTTPFGGAVSGVNGETISSLSAQTYTVVITDLTSGCTDEVSRAVPNNVQPPLVSVDNVNPNTICDPALSVAADYDGSIEVTAGIPLTDYSYYFFDGDVASPVPASADYDVNNVYSGLQSGDYTVVIVENATGCESDRVVVTVPDATVDPVGSIALDLEQTACVGSNGELTASATTGGGASADGYSFAWYEGTGTTTPFGGAVSGVNGETISSLSAQTYTVVITDLTSGCTDEVSRAVPNNVQPPLVSVDNVNPNTICDPALSVAADYDGSIEVTAGIPLTDYSYYFFDGDVASPVPASADYDVNNVYSGLQSGDYTVVIVENATGCESDRVVVTVPDATVDPVGSIALDLEQTACVGSNGELTASATTGGGASADGYSFAWYEGTGTTTPFGGAVSGVNGETISSLSAQTYTVVITDLTSGCTDEVSRAVPNNVQPPLVSVDNVNPNTICDPALSVAADYDGSIEVTAGIPLTDYSYYFFDGDVASPVPASADYDVNNVYSGLQSGDYTVVIVENATGCESDRVVVTVPDATVDPVGSIALDLEQTACVGSNGELTASATTGGGASADGYSFAWYEGTGTTTPFGGAVSGVNGETISSLSAQTYTVVITDLTSGCTDEVSRAVPNNVQPPLVSVDNVNPNTICDPALSVAADYDGSIEVTAGIPLTDYSYYFFDGDVASPVPASADYDVNNVYSGLQSGDYTVVIVENATGCESDRVVVTVPDATVDPVGSIALDLEQTACVGSNGELTASATTGGGASADGYSFAWYEGTGTTTPFGGAVSGVNGETISSLSAQSYTVVVTDLSTGCQSESSRTVAADIQKPIISIDPNADITANTVCNPALTPPMSGITYAGVIQSNVTYDGAPITIADYRFDWYVGPTVTGAPDFSGVGADTYSLLNGGSYTLVVERFNAGPGQGCVSDPITVTVPNDFTTPTVSFFKDALQTSCGSPNGRLIATGASGSGSYSYEWFVGTNATTAFNDGVDGNITGADGETIEDIASGDYTVRVTDLATGCQTVQDIYLGENIIDPVVTLTVTTPMTDCSFDGVITPTITSANAAPSGHTFTWHAGQSLSDPVIATTTDAGAANPELSTSNAGTAIYSGYYTVVVTDIFTGCVSSSATIFLDRPAPLFDIAFQVNLPPSSCTANEGIITAWVDSNSDDILDPAEIPNYFNYTFEWYEGGPTDPTDSYYTNPNPSFSGPALEVDRFNTFGSAPVAAGTPGTDYFMESNAFEGASLFDVTSGRYTIVITDLNNCKEYLTVDLDYQDGATVVVGDVTDTKPSQCSVSNGSITVNTLAGYPGLRGFSDYEFMWYAGANADPGNLLAETTNVLSGLSPGYYTVAPKELFSPFCELTPYTYFLDSAYRQPVLTPAITPSTSCVGNGSITIVPSKGAGDTTPATTYSYTWPDDVTEITDTRSDLLPGDYTVIVTDDNSTCSVSRTFTIPDERVIPAISAMSPTAQTYCNANGTLTILDGAISPGTTGEYDFNVYFNGTDAADLITPTQTAIAGGVEFSGLASGTYYVSATRNVVGAAADGCTSAFIQEDVANDLDPLVVNVTSTANTSCNASVSADGTIEVELETPSGVSAIEDASYDITFDVSGAATGASIDPFTTGAGPGPFSVTFPQVPSDNITNGVYELTITNNVSGCSVTRTVTVEDNPEPIVFSRADLTVESQELCDSDGRIVVNNTISPNNTGDLTEYSFRYYTSSADAVAGSNPLLDTGGSPISGGDLNTTNYPSLSAGVYYVVAYRGNFSEGAFCESAPVRVEIPNGQVKPVLSLSQTANTSCDPATSSDATISVDMSMPTDPTNVVDDAIEASNFDIAIRNSAAALVAQRTDVNGTETFNAFNVGAFVQIVPGTYEVTITNRVSNCFKVETIEVKDNPEPIVFSRADLTVESQELCDSDGRIVVNNTISPNNTGDLTEYSFRYYTSSADAVAGSNPLLDTGGSPISGGDLNTTNYPSLSAGVYYVVAYRGNFSEGAFCESTPVRVEIPNGQVKPVLSLSQTANTSCDPATSSDATISVDMSMPTDPTNVVDDAIEASNFDIAIRNSAAALVAQRTDVNGTETFNSFNVGAFVQIVPGTYEVTITNRVSNCFKVETIEVKDNPEPIVFSRADLTVESQELCDADGRIVVNNTISPNNTGDLTEYSFRYYTSSADAVAGSNPLLDTGGSEITGGDLNTTNYPILSAGVYYVVAYRGNFSEGAFCESAPVRVEIPNGQVKPVLSLSQTANTSCDPATSSDATISVDMSMPTDPTNVVDDAIEASNFDIAIRNSAAALVAQRTDVNGTETFNAFNVGAFVQIVPGTYEVTITNRVSNCFKVETIEVKDNPEPIVFSRADLAVESQELCDPDGRILVNNTISPNNTGDLTEYSFRYYTSSADAVAGSNPLLDTGGSPISGGDLNTTNYPSLSAGVYYVVAYRGNFSEGAFCESTPVRVEIPNGQVKPVLSLSQTANTSCDPATSSDATISVDMSMPTDPTNVVDDAIEASNFDIAIRNSAAALVAQRTDVNGTETFNSFNVGAFVQIVPGTYEVTITNRVSNCFKVETIEVKDNPEPIVFSRADLTVESQELCDADGRIVVNNTISPNKTGDLTEYSFRYYTSSADAVAGSNPLLDTGGSEITGGDLNTTNYPSLSAGVYYVVAYRGNFSEGAFCESAPVRVEIPNGQVKPVLSLSQTANTSCDPATSSDATISVDMSMPADPTNVVDDAIEASNFDIAIRNSAAALVAQRTDVNGTETFNAFNVGGFVQIVPGIYEVTITNRVSNCFKVETIEVKDNPEPIVFSRADLTVESQELCDPDGRILVNNTISPNNTGDLTEYSFRYYTSSADAVAGSNPLLDTGGSEITGGDLNTTNYPILSAGVYYVVAYRGNFSEGAFCESTPVRVEVPNIQVAPVLSLTQTANTACDPDPSSDATISVEMSTPSPTVLIEDATYTIDFTNVPIGASLASFTTGAGPGPLSVTFPQAGTDLILPGTYEVMVTNDVSNCSVSRSITVEDKPEPIILGSADISVMAALDCSASGSITVNTIQPVNIGNYTFRWYQGENNYTNDDPIAGETTNSISALSPGEYYVQAIRNAGENRGSTCISNAVRVVIEDDSEGPAVLIVENAPNSSCDPANPNGSISASVPGFATSDYTFEWFIGLNNTTNPVAAANISGVDGETISGLAAGNYTLRITDNTSPGESCETIESFLLTEDLTISIPTDVQFAIVPQSDCFDSGSITVSSVSPGVPADYSYEWYYESFNASGLIAGENSATLTGRPAGNYYVMITNIATQCTLGDPIQRVIPNQSVPPSIELRDGKPNTDCDITNPDGFLEVTADLGQIAGYSFQWYEGEMPLNSGAASIGNLNRINQLDSGYYSVVVQSSTTNCSDTAQFYVEFIPELPKISLTTSPVTKCGSPNGSAYAQIYNLEGNFAFNWYIGSSVGGQPDFTGDWLTDMPVGEYTVEAIDLGAPACISEPITFTISELIEVPQLKLNQISPNTYCDPAKVNGVAEVVIYYVDEEDVSDTLIVTSNFEVLWYRTASLPGGAVEYNGRINATLSAAEYTVTYMNVATNCLWEQNIVITEDLTVVPPPEIAVTELFDSCEEPNGAAEIAAATQNSNYIYKWYLNEIGDLADFEATEVGTLDLGTYLVTATDTVSGCVSKPTEVTITDDREAPIISLTLTEETCGDFNGVATITINEDYEYRTIEWDTPDGIATGTSYDAFTAGEYAVTVIGSNGCAYTKTFSIGSEINVFNGFSPNGDGVNDEWEIGCIESFNGNKVEIYNRAGALVFATENYRNAGNGFKGLGNRGLYAGNRELPDGTYFYVIIKGDGSESVTGYIEMFR